MWQSKTVLLAEDHPDNRVIYATLLQHEGYHVLQAADGAEALQMARDHRPDLILMNLSLPLINGCDATEFLRSDPCTATIPIVVITAHVDPAIRQEAWDAGADAYLVKPVEPRRVVEEVERRIGRANP